MKLSPVFISYGEPYKKIFKITWLLSCKIGIYLIVFIHFFEDIKMKTKNNLIVFILISMENVCIHDFSVCLTIGSNPADINWFQSHTI